MSSDNKHGLLFRPFRADDAEGVFITALASWRATYKGIFSLEFIEEFVGKYYSAAALQRESGRIERNESFFYVAVRPGSDRPAIAGFCHIGERGGGWELFRIYAHPDFFGSGTGREFLRLGEEFLRQKGAAQYFCMVHEANEPGKNFYLRNGFTHIPEKDDDDHWYMEKMI